MLRRLFLDQDLLPLIVGCVIGLGGGLGAIAFRELVDASSRSFRYLRDHEAWPHWVAVPATVALGGLLVGVITRYFAREVKGHGVPEVMSAVAHKKGVIRLRVVFTKAIASALSIGSGGSVGREGPIVQIGSALGSALGQALRAPVLYTKIMVSCGAAAGVSATFNAPFAGVLFAIEVIAREFRFRSLTPVVCASVVAAAVSRAYFGNVPAFPVPALTLGHPAELGFYVVLGVLAGAMGVFFSRFLYVVEDVADRIRMPDPIMAACGGLIVGLMALQFHQVMGVGYETIETALGAPGQLTVGMFVILFFAKVLATSITLASGGSGGVFAPSLFLGAMVGGGFGLALHGVLPDLVEQPGAYALVGMGALVGATTHAPLSAIVILFELTDDYKIILPLMLASVVATVVSKKLSPESIYTIKLSRRGEHIVVDPAANILALSKVEDALVRTNVDPLPEGATFASIVKALTESRVDDLAVVDAEGRFAGVIRFQSLKIMLGRQELHRALIAKDFCDENPDRLTPEDTLDHAFRMFQETTDQFLPVVSPGEERFLGFLSRADVIAHYKTLVHIESAGRHPDET